MPMKQAHSKCVIKMRTGFSLLIIYLYGKLKRISLSIDFQWKRVIERKKCTSLNTHISFSAYRIYKYNLYCRLESLKKMLVSKTTHVKESLYG